MDATTRFQYFSDLHAEFHFTKPGYVKALPIEARAPYLVLAGDIGYTNEPVYERFLRRVSAMFTWVFYVSGNHEYYTTKPIEKTDAEIRAITRRVSNVIFLQNESFAIPNTDVVVFGSTLWSDIHPDERASVARMLNDYRYIKRFTIDKELELYRASKKALIEFLDASTEKRVVIITHHLPSYSLVSAKHAHSGANSAFASALDELVDRPCVKAWFAGHTHAPCELGKCHVNPIGYIGENANVDYNKVVAINFTS